MIIGSYTVDATSGVLRYTPKMKHQDTPHVESVNIGDKEFIKLPNSSVDQDSSTKEVSAKEQNQYMDQGATFNADSSSQTKVGMILRAYLYYGGAAVILKDGHLEFTAKGAKQQAKQLSIGSLSTQTLASLKIQVKSQLNQQNQHLQLNLKNQN